MIRNLFSNRCLINFEQQLRHIGKKEINIKNPEKEAQMPIFQYPISSSNVKRVYVWGSTETGALGIGMNGKLKKSKIWAPNRLSFAEKHSVTDIACGFGFTAIAVKSNDENKVYGCGINTDSQLGYHQLNNEDVDLVLYPLPIIIPFKNKTDTKVLKLSAGRAHLLILTTEGLFTLGNNSYGQCGRPIVANEKYSGSHFVHHIPSIYDENIIDIKCGQDHSLLLNKKGEVFSCGWSADGQTGLGHYNNQCTFKKISGDIKGEKIIKFSCKSDCVLALNEKGEIFGWGNSEYGQILGKNDNQQINTPVRLPQCKNIGKIIDIAAGGSFCMALNEEGSVFVWGYGLLGKGPEVSLSNNPTEIPQILFGKNDFQPDTKVVAITCGLGYMAAITNSGDLYMWGKNKNGCLGLIHKNDQYFPLKVSVGASVEKLSCGIDHTVAICKPFI